MGEHDIPRATEPRPPDRERQGLLEINDRIGGFYPTLIPLDRSLTLLAKFILVGT